MFTTERPAVAADSDATGVEIGLRFKSSANGLVDGVRFYKGPGNTGQHIGNLWTATGKRLASAAFGAETPSGWQSVTFAAPVSVAAGTTYVASYYAPRGHYASTESYFTSPRTAGTLSAPAGTNGVYRYGSASAYPTASWRSSNYWVDITFRAGHRHPDDDSATPPHNANDNAHPAPTKTPTTGRPPTPHQDDNANPAPRLR